MEDIPDVKVEPDESMQPDVNVEPDVKIQPEPPKDNNIVNEIVNDIVNDIVPIEPQTQTPEPVMKFLEVLNKDIETVRKQKDKVYEDCPICGKTMLKKSLRYNHLANCKAKHNPIEQIKPVQEHVAPVIQTPVVPEPIVSVPVVKSTREEILEHRKERLNLGRHKNKRQ